MWRQLVEGLRRSMDVGLAVDALCIPVLVIAFGACAVVWSYDTPLPTVADLPLRIQRRVRGLFWVAIIASIAMLVQIALVLTHHLPATLAPMTVVGVTTTMVCEAAMLRL